MTESVLYIGNRRYSSWSLRAYLGLRAAGLPFRCEMIWLDTPSFGARVRQVSGACRVPALATTDGVIWDSLAICEFAAEHAPLWPQDIHARAIARAYAAEMHAGFEHLRRELPMDLGASISRTPSTEAWLDITRVCELWREARALAAHRGPFLFGEFSVADCMFAPVVTRFVTYGVEVDASCRAYMDAVLELPDLRAWAEMSADEPELPDP